MNSRLIGGILLIVGTSIGGGMLALPIANAATGFWQSTFFLILCWAAMTAGAFLILEANLYLKNGGHMVSMALLTLGKWGSAFTWLIYLILLYTLLCAYISGGSDVLNSLLKKMGYSLSDTYACLLFVIVFGAVVYSGIRQVDWLNRGLMFGKLGAFFFLIILISPYVDVSHFQGGDFHNISGTIMILITSFGFAIIVPNLRDYFEDDIKKLKQAILIGSLIPLFCYIAWDAVIMGSIANEGPHSLQSLIKSAHSTSDLAQQLSETIDNSLIQRLFHFFISISMLTAFLGVSLCLITFLADGFKWQQKGLKGGVLFTLTYLPPLIIVLHYPGAYIDALNYAGIFCVLLLLLLPAIMCWSGRSRYHSEPLRYRVMGGQYLIAAVIIVSIILLTNSYVHLL
ncbi:amino acid permease [Legionella sp. W05-934-2]|jgi:tyrosine-specific transport protein|uniref:amino acid permease n=1 Tax=Legionella sp. W05-934-2 TaxID=1198649 RepID=UPI003461FD22